MGVAGVGTLKGEYFAVVAAVAMPLGEAELVLLELAVAEFAAVELVWPVVHIQYMRLDPDMYVSSVLMHA